MYLNVARPQPEGGGLRTPEILNSLIGLTSPPLQQPTSCKQESSIELMSPVSSIQGDDGRSWTPMGPEPRIEQCSRLPSNQPQPQPSNTTPHPCWSQPLPSLTSSLLTPTSDGNPNSPENFISFPHHNISGNSPSENNQVCPKIYIENTCDDNHVNTSLPQTYSNYNNHTESLPVMNSPQSEPPIPYSQSSNEIPQFPGTNPPELTSPISTVEETRMALVKEGLKLTITSKLQQINPLANNPNHLAQFFSQDSIVTKYELTPDDEERRYRRRERNKVAATKCRNKKKETTAILVSESSMVHELNIRLKNEVQRLTEEKNRLERSLSDLDHRSSCKHVGKSKLLNQNYLQLTSSCATKLKSKQNTSSNLHGFKVDDSPSHLSQSSASPCSIGSLLSPCDTKSFINNLSVFDDNESEIVSSNVANVIKKSPDMVSSPPYSETNNSENIVDNKFPTPNNPNCPKSYNSSRRYQPYINAIINSKFIPKGSDSFDLIQTKLSHSYPGTNTASVLSDHEKSISLFEKINPFTYPSNDTNAQYESQPCGDQFYANDLFSDTNDLSIYCSDNLNQMDSKPLLTDKYQLNADIMNKRNGAFNNTFTNQNIERMMSYTNL